MTAQFRIGGVYRNREGMLVRLCAEGAIGQTGIDLSRAAYSNRINEDGTLTKYGCGICDLATGRMGEKKNTYADLVTAELTLVNGQWVPLGVAEEAPKTYTSCSIDFGESWTLLEQLSKPALDAELAAAAAKFHAEVAASLAKTVCGDYFVVASEEAVHWVSHDISDTFEFLPSETAAERVRPPLTWATPKPVDRWEGYAVKSGSDEFLHALLDGVHPLQRMTDPSDPLHASAHLRKG